MTLRMRRLMTAIALLLAMPEGGHAVQTENLGFRVLPAPGRMAADGRIDDWDL